jgi:ribonuclease T2
MRLNRIVKAAIALFSLGLLVSGAALAQRGDRGEPGQFDYYALALSWSPTFCAETGDRRGDPQCGAKRERPYAFVLHGLWPQHERGWPQDCRSSDRGWVPGPVADRMLDIMPSKKLVFYEYRKHGTCSGLGVDAYFKLSRQLFEKVKIPPRLVRVTDDRMTIGVAELIGEFQAANPALKPDMLVVTCGGAGNRLKEVRICFTKSGDFRSCGPNENQRRLCSADRMYVPPVRMGASKE